MFWGREKTYTCPVKFIFLKKKLFVQFKCCAISACLPQRGLHNFYNIPIISVCCAHEVERCSWVNSNLFHAEVVISQLTNSLAKMQHCKLDHSGDECQSVWTTTDCNNFYSKFSQATFANGKQRNSSNSPSVHLHDNNHCIALLATGCMTCV